MNVNWHCRRNGHRSSALDPLKALGAHSQVEFVGSGGGSDGVGIFWVVVVCPSMVSAWTRQIIRSSDGEGWDVVGVGMAGAA